MRHLVHVLALAALFALALMSSPGAAAAQSDILLQLRSGSPPGDRVRVDSAGGFVAMGSLGIGIIPASGEGSRMMWYPAKVAFRAGYADAGLQFDDVNIGYYSWAGGALSMASGNYAFAMGNQNRAAAQCSVALGSGNTVFGDLANGVGTCGIALGLNNTVRDQAGIALGQNASSNGDAAVAIGYRTTADANYSVAIGHRASTNGHTGAMVFADASTTDSIEASANHQFSVRAAGGFRFRTNPTLTTGCNLPAGSGVFTCSSSKLLKENFEAVDGEEVLSRIRMIPVTTWNYTAEGRQVRHLGPFAEDFHHAFGLGTDDKNIGLLDIDGVNFAGVKALEKRSAELQSENQALRTEVEQLKAKQAEMERRLERVEAALAPRP